MRYIFLILLTGCSAAGTQISSVLDATEKCQGKAKLEIQVSDEQKATHFTCEWEAAANE